MAEIFSLLNGQLILLAAILFSLGLALADPVLERNIRWLIAYPTWVYRQIENLLNRFSGTLPLFLFIFVFNAVNLFVGYVSGFLVLMPLLLAVWTGLNVGIVLRKNMPQASMLVIFLNPVSLLELPASWISFSLGIEMGMIYLQEKKWLLVQALFWEKLPVFKWLVLPLLAAAGLLESAIIQYVRRHTENGEGDDQK